MAVNTERETFKREATFRTKPPFQALNTNPSSHFPRCICFLLQPPVFISPFSHHLVLLPPSPRFLTLCSPAQTLTAAESSLCQGLGHVSVLLRDTKFDNNLEAIQLASRCSLPKKGPQRVLKRFSRGSWKIVTSLTTCGGTVCRTDFYYTAVVRATVVQNQKC